MALAEANADDLKDHQTRKKEVQQLERLHVRGAIKTRLLAMANSDNQAHEVLFSFWLNHFSIYAPKSIATSLAVLIDAVDLALVVPL